MAALLSHVILDFVVRKNHGDLVAKGGLSLPLLLILWGLQLGVILDYFPLDDAILDIKRDGFIVNLRTLRRICRTSNA